MKRFLIDVALICGCIVVGAVIGLAILYGALQVILHVVF